MSWNHRVLAHKDGYLQIHEVYYKEEGIPYSYTSNAIGASGESLEDIEWTLNKMKECLSKPILCLEPDFPKEYKL
jgi:hypothetical protein